MATSLNPIKIVPPPLEPHHPQPHAITSASAVLSVPPVLPPPPAPASVVVASPSPVPVPLLPPPPAESSSAPLVASAQQPTTSSASTGTATDPANMLPSASASTLTLTNTGHHSHMHALNGNGNGSSNGAMPYYASTSSGAGGVERSSPSLSGHAGGMTGIGGGNGILSSSGYAGTGMGSASALTTFGLSVESTPALSLSGGGVNGGVSSITGIAPREASSIPPSSPSHGDAKVDIFGYDLTEKSAAFQFSVVAAGLFVCYFFYGVLQEYIFSLDGFSFGWYLTLVQFAIYAVMSWAQIARDNERVIFVRRAPLSRYALIAFLSVATVGLSNVACQYLNYPTQVLFKSCKTIPVMLVGVCYLGKKYTGRDYLSVILLSLGIVIFSLGSAGGSAAAGSTKPVTDAAVAAAASAVAGAASNTVVAAGAAAGAAAAAAAVSTSAGGAAAAAAGGFSFPWFGVITISFALLADALIGNVQEKVLQSFDASASEMIYYTKLIGLSYIMFVLVATGELVPAMSYCWNSPSVYIFMAAFSIVGCIGENFVMVLLKRFGALIAVITTSSRKFLTMVASFLIFPKPFTIAYAIGMSMVFAGMGLEIYIKNEKAILLWWKQYREKSQSRGGGGGGGVATEMV